MRRRENVFLTFFFFLFLSALLIIFSKVGFVQSFQGVVLVVLSPVQTISTSASRSISSFLYPKEAKILLEERTELVRRLVEQASLLQENKALKDQFQTREISSSKLLPAQVLGAPGFIPGISVPSKLILDRGEKDGVVVGQAVIYKNNLVGKISKVSDHRSVATLVADSSFSLTVKTLPGDKKQESANGIVKGLGGKDLILENVTLDETLKVSDLVITFGNAGETGVGVPANLVVGKITSVEKKPSALFQTARVKSFVDPAHTSNVFIVVMD